MFSFFYSFWLFPVVVHVVVVVVVLVVIVDVLVVVSSFAIVRDVAVS